MPGTLPAYLLGPKLERAERWRMEGSPTATPQHTLRQPHAPPPLHLLVLSRCKLLVTHSPSSVTGSFFDVYVAIGHKLLVNTLPPASVYPVGCPSPTVRYNLLVTRGIRTFLDFEYR